MLSAEERSEIETELARYPDRRAAAIFGLQVVQRRQGWVSDAALAEVAEMLEISVHQLEAVATFYSLIFRRPVGRHVVLLCDCATCWMVGCDGLAARLRERLGVDAGVPSPDGRFTWLPAACLGVCEQAPALMIDEELHVGLSPERLDALLERHGAAGRR